MTCGRGEGKGVIINSDVRGGRRGPQFVTAVEVTVVGGKKGRGRGGEGDVFWRCVSTFVVGPPVLLHSRLNRSRGVSAAIVDYP